MPKLTLAIREKIETINKKTANTNITLAEKVKAQYGFIVETLGPDTAKEILGTDDINSMDINELSILYLDICKAYDRPFYDAQKQDINPADRELVLEFLRNPDLVKNMAKNNAFKGVL